MSRFPVALQRIGKPVVLRKRSGNPPDYGEEGSLAWIDSMIIGEVQELGVEHPLISAGVLEEGDAQGFFSPDADLAVDDRVILNLEYLVHKLSRKQLRGETAYLKALLKRAHESITASFYGEDRVFYDDFGSYRESWPVKSGSWSIVNEEYVGEAADVNSVAQALAGDLAWKDYVLEARVKVASGDAGVICRFTSPGGVDQFYEAVLRVEEGIFALEGSKGAEWSRLREAKVVLEYDRVYTVRVHCFRGFLFLFLDGAWMFTESDLAFLESKIGLEALGGKAVFDEVEVWT